MVRGLSADTSKLKKQRVLVEAAALFAKKGFDGTTVDEIAERLSLTKGTIYHYIPSKQLLAYELHIFAVQVFIDRLATILNSDNPPDVKLRNFIVSHIAQHLEDDLKRSSCGMLLLALSRSQLDIPPELRKRIVRKRDKYLQMVRGVIQEGIDKGVFVKCDVDVVCLYIFGALNYTVTWFKEKGRLSREEIASQFADLTLTMLLADRSGLLDGRLLPDQLGYHPLVADSPRDKLGTWTEGGRKDV